MSAKRAVQRRANARPKPAPPKSPEPQRAPEVRIVLAAAEAEWLVVKLAEVAIPTAQGKMLAASIQAKVEAEAERLNARTE